MTFQKTPFYLVTAVKTSNLTTKGFLVKCFETYMFRDLLSEQGTRMSNPVFEWQ
jgi:hypothetical protein